ncbi:hypothetical protein NLJ89_g10528 [Agrocybe chaxingu]|uniref:Autophagy-related protein n=1 Tax=Agrocybe chaxingu TaxID=84603 RepID=A0A9W8MNU6_9AGAR|nr:hypothetical protein NLJ89_g10528 [Agrocybe chaxingu]
MFDSTFNLRDTEHFPTLSDLPVDNGYSPNQMDFFEYGPWGISKPIKHWCLLAEVVEQMPWMRPAYRVKDKNGEPFVVAFHLDDGPVVMVTTGPIDEVAPHLTLPESFSKTLKPGHVMALMYGQNHRFMDGNKGVRVEDLNRVKTFPCGLSTFLRIGDECSGEDRRKAERQRERKRLDQRRLRARKRGLIAENSGSTMELPELREPFTVSPVVTLQAPSPNAANAEKENTPQTEVTEGDSNVFQHLEAIEDQLLGINAIALNNQTIARNRLSQPYCEPLRKTVPGHNIDRVLALTPQPADRHGLVAPPQPERIGSVPPIWNENICGYSTKDVAELMLFYNEYFGIVEADDEGANAQTLCDFSEVFVIVSLTLFLPICLEQFARDNGFLLPDKTIPCSTVKPAPSTGHASSVDGADEAARCVVKIGWAWIDTASFSLYVYSFSVALQALTVISMGGIADHPPHRKVLLLSFAALGSIAATLFLLLPSSSPVWYLSALLALSANVGFGASIVAMNAYIPSLAKEAPEVVKIWEDLQNLDHSFESDTDPDISIESPSAPLLSPSNAASETKTQLEKEYQTELSRATSRISSLGIALGYGAGICLLIVALVPVTKMGGSTFALRLAIGLSGIWWATKTSASGTRS